MRHATPVAWPRRPRPGTPSFPWRQHVRVRLIWPALAPSAECTTCPGHGRTTACRLPARPRLPWALLARARLAAPVAQLGARGQESPHGVPQAAAASRGRSIACTCLHPTAVASLRCTSTDREASSLSRRAAHHPFNLSKRLDMKNTEQEWNDRACSILYFLFQIEQATPVNDAANLEGGRWVIGVCGADTCCGGLARA